jgi:hypothetical protein
MSGGSFAPDTVILQLAISAFETSVFPSDAPTVQTGPYKWQTDVFGSKVNAAQFAVSVHAASQTSREPQMS